MAIKKAYQEIVSFLEANRDEQVNEVIDTVIQMASAKTGGGGGKASTFHRNEAGDVVAIRCFYHQKWMSPLVVEFGKKASSASGYNSMCKDGVSKWTKQNREFKSAQQELLQRVMNGEVAQDEIADEMARLEEEKSRIIPLEGDYQGFDTLDECLADLEERGLV